jgi:hypothetical protein
MIVAQTILALVAFAIAALGIAGLISRWSDDD